MTYIVVWGYGSAWENVPVKLLVTWKLVWDTEPTGEIFVYCVTFRHFYLLVLVQSGMRKTYPRAVVDVYVHDKGCLWFTSARFCCCLLSDVKSCTSCKSQLCFLISFFCCCAKLPSKVSNMVIAFISCDGNLWLVVRNWLSCEPESAYFMDNLLQLKPWSWCTFMLSLISKRWVSCVSVLFFWLSSERSSMFFF